MCEEVTYGEFKSHTKDFLKQLITKPSQAKIDDFLSNCLKEKGISQGDFVKKLIDGNIVTRKTKVDDGLGEKGSGKPSYSISYKVPAERFEHKLKKLHISLFEENLPDDVITEEGGGATSCAFDGAGQFIQPMNGGMDESGIIRRKTIYMTEEQFNSLMNSLDEATTTTNAGNYQYDVPFPVDSDDPTMKHNKGKKRGSAENAIGMDRLTEDGNAEADAFERYWEEFEDWMDSYDQSDYPTSYTNKDIARHFYELGLKNRTLNEEGGYDMSTPEGRQGAENWMHYIMSQEDPAESAAREWAQENGLDGDENIIRAFAAGVEYGRQYE